MLRAIALTLCLFSAGACAAPAGFQLGDDSAGPTCANYTSSGTLAWSQPGGDWADAAGQLYGDKAFSTLLVTQSKTRQILDMDLTDLVRGWVEKRYPNDGMLLRVLPG
ncbi:MAG: hypothetical protein JNJ60_08700, partial [Rhodocyclaceae bacterium]|nr:hypothetical protein [Rhodocyclaceae bacterium]